MLKNANEHSKRMVLGKHTEAFNALTKPGGQYEKDPQGAVRKLLGNPLPPGASPPRPTKGPKPTPPKPKAPKPAKPAKPAPAPAPAPPSTPPTGGSTPKELYEQSTRSLGRGMFGEARLTPDGVVKFGHLTDAELKMLKHLSDSGVTPRFIDVEIVSDYANTFPGVGRTRRGYLQMGEAPGKSAASLLSPAASPLDKQEKTRIFDALIKARGRIHTLGVAHQDVHAGNVIWDSASGQLTLIDMTTARVDARAALIEALGTRRGRMNLGKIEQPGDYQSSALFRELNPGNVQAKNPVWQRFNSNRKAVEQELRNDGLYDAFQAASIRTVPRTISSGMTQDRAMKLIQMLYEGLQ